MADASTDDALDTKAARRQHPSGVLYLLGPESVPLLVDALLDLPPGRELTQSELAEHAGVTRQTVATHLDRLLETNVLEPVPNSSPQRYRMAEGSVVEELHAFNGALNAAME